MFAHGAIKALACDMMKIANDVRWLSSGPRCGLGEIFIPENEPGSSIMPGKVNPTQCEQVTMVAVQVMGNDVTVGMAASQGNFELNVFMPVCIYNFLQSARLLAQCMVSFNDNCVVGITANAERCRELVDGSVGVITAICPKVGYKEAADIAKAAIKTGASVRQVLEDKHILSDEEIDQLLDPATMV